MKILKKPIKDSIFNQPHIHKIKKYRFFLIKRCYVTVI